MKDGFPVSVDELITADQRPLPSEAVAIVLDLCRQVMQQTAVASVLRPISTATLFLDASGTVTVAGGVAGEDDQTGQLLGRLLLQMLPPEDAAASRRVPARLRTVARRAADGRGPRVTVAGLAGRLRRFGPEDPQAAIRGLFERWRQRGPERLPRRVVPGREMVERRVNGPGPDVLRRWLREADEEAFRQVSVAARPHRRYRAVVGLVAVVLLVLAGLGATYWLRADEERPWVPLPPAFPARQAPPPAQPGWELLPDPAGLVVRHAPEPRRPESPAMPGPTATAGQSERAPSH